MATDLHYKDDATFLKYLTMSFVGESAAIELMKPYGHEFEFDGYGAGSRELFKDELLKKKRTPDLICKLCKQKLEVRAKSNLKIAMSDSASRPFDRELKAEDWVGFVRVIMAPVTYGISSDPLDPASYSIPKEIYIASVAELSRTKTLARQSQPKSEGKGSEKFLEWPTLLAPCNGVILGVTREPTPAIYLMDNNGKQIRCTPPTGSFTYKGLRIGHTVTKNETLICGIAKLLPAHALQCSAKQAA
ncbi:hypothetical protein [Vibrio fluvialis]|uniref:hypothetical protein n=1 Tax=Vibrio fluvialis TaxID=676 RepID=UPI00301B7516